MAKPDSWMPTNFKPVKGLRDGEVVEVTNPLQKLVDDHIAEQVDHPTHYNAHPSGIECIDVVRHMNFNLGNVVKYVWRAGEKDPTKHLQDLKKARWYLDDEIERLSKNA